MNQPSFRSPFAGRIAVVVGLLAAGAMAPTAKAQELPKAPESVPLLWRIEPLSAEGPPSYLFGTVHLGDSRVTDLPSVVTDAILGCDVVWTEYAEPPNADELIAASTFLPEDESLMTLLGQTHATTLRRLLGETGMQSMEPFLDRMQPIAATVILDSLERPEILSEDGVDDVVERIGVENDKEIGGVETMQEQIDVLGSIDLPTAVRMLRRSIDRFDERRREGRSGLEELLLTYLRGDEERILESTLVQMSPDDPAMAPFLEALVWNRNRNMATRTAAWIRANEDRSLFLAVGAAHLGGDHGVIALLEGEGFRLTRIPDELTRARLAVEWARFDLRMAEYRLEQLVQKGETDR